MNSFVARFPTRHLLHISPNRPTSKTDCTSGQMVLGLARRNKGKRVLLLPSHKGGFVNSLFVPFLGRDILLPKS